MDTMEVLRSGTASIVALIILIVILIFIVFIVVRIIFVIRISITILTTEGLKPRHGCVLSASVLAQGSSSAFR